MHKNHITTECLKDGEFLKMHKNHITAEWVSFNKSNMRIMDGQMQFCAFENVWTTFLPQDNSYLLEEISSGRLKTCDKYEEEPLVTQFTVVTEYNTSTVYRITATKNDFDLEFQGMTDQGDSIWRKGAGSEILKAFYYYALNNWKSK